VITAHTNLAQSVETVGVRCGKCKTLIGWDRCKHPKTFVRSNRKVVPPVYFSDTEHNGRNFTSQTSERGGILGQEGPGRRQVHLKRAAMSSLVTDSSYWRKRAAELRALADDTTDAEEKNCYSSCPRITRS
jgi:hypothetical protein